MTTQRHSPENHNLNLHRRENLKTLMRLVCSAYTVTGCQFLLWSPTSHQFFVKVLRTIDCIPAAWSS